MGLHKKVGTHQDYIWLSLSSLPVRDRTQTGLTGQPSFFLSGVWISRSSRGMTLHSGKSVSTILNSPIKPALLSPDEVGGQARLGGGG